MDTQNTWPLSEAKSQFVSLIEKALTDPQTITIGGNEAFVVLSADKYWELKRKSLPSIADYLCGTLDDETADYLDEIIAEGRRITVDRGTPVEFVD